MSQSDGMHDAAGGTMPLDPRELRLFRALDLENEGSVVVGDLLDALAEEGLRHDDLRLADLSEGLSRFGRRDRLPPEAFADAIRPNILLIERALQGRTPIPDFADFTAEVDRIFASTRENRDGAVADYIPQLARVEPDEYGVSLCTVFGQRHALGNTRGEFCVQSCCKPITYCAALEQHGEDYVHRFVGREPSGLNFNELALGQDGEPHNPMINAGAIICSSMIRPDLDVAGRFDALLEVWTALCGKEKVHFNNAVYQSERNTADRNFALGYYMREHGSFPEDTDMLETLELYFQSCSIELNVEMLSVLAATLANGGVCPITGDRVLRTKNVQHCLSLMLSCGMYDYSGEFAFSVGLPAKSGVSGAMIVVVPNVMGLALWSPRIDTRGNPVRCIEFCKELVDRFSFHNYDIFTEISEKRDPRISRVREKARVGSLIWAASKGDHGAVHRFVVRGFDQDEGDYDGRTALHLAAAEGRDMVVSYLLDNGATVNPVDRWGRTPLDDAIRHGHGTVAGLLRAGGGETSDPADSADGAPESPIAEIRDGDDSRSDLVVEMIYAASEGDLRSIRRLVARGVSLDESDYDRRTPLHLAAAEGHEALVQYFIDQGVFLSPRDRWAGSPVEDAQRHGHTRVVRLLESHL